MMASHDPALTWIPLAGTAFPANEHDVIEAACFLLTGAIPLLDIEGVEESVGRPLIQPRGDEPIIEYASLDHRDTLPDFTVTRDWFKPSGRGGLVEEGCFGARLAVRWWHPGNAHGGIPARSNPAFGLSL